MWDPTQAEYFKDIVATIREPLLVLDADLRVLVANRSFYKFFKVKSGETAGRLIYELGNRQWDIPGLRALLETILPQKAVFNDYEVEHGFPGIGRRTMRLNARRIPKPPEKPQWILLAFEDDTERKEAEVSLKETERVKTEILEKLNEAQHLALIGSWEWDLITDHVWWSDETYRIFGVTAQDFVPGFEAKGKFIHPDDFERYSKAFEHSFQTGEPLDLDTRLITNDGRLKYCQAKGRIVYDESGKPIRFIGTIMDITERKQAEDKISTSENELRSLFAAMTDAVFVLDGDGRYISIAPTNPINLYRPAEELLGKTLHEVLPKEQADYMLAKICQAIQSKQTVHGEYALQINGKEIWFESSISRLSGNSVFWVAHDISERKQAEEALKQSEEKFRLSFMTGLDGFYWATLEDGRIVEINPVFEEVFGYSREQVIGRTSLELGLFQDPNDRAKMVTELKEQGFIKNLELIGRKKDGESITVSLSASTTWINNRAYILGIVRDVSERKRVEKALQEKVMLLESAHELARLGSYKIDLPLQTIFLSAEMARLYGAGEEAISLPLDEYRKRFYHPDDLEKDSKFANAVYESGKPLFIETRVIRSDGKVNWVQARSKPAGTSILGMVQDITESKQMLDKLRESEERYKLLFESSPLAINITRGPEIIYANPSYLKMFGFSALDELKDRLPMELFPSEYHPKILENIQRRAKGLPVPNAYEAECFRKDGTRFPILMYLTRTIFADGPATVAFIIDITDRKRAEERIERQFKHLLALSNIDRLIASNFDLNLSLSEILNYVTKELGVDAADVFILNPNSLTLEFGAERGFHTNTVRKTQIRLGESYAGRTALERQIVQIPNLKNETDKAFLSTHLAGEDFACYYGVPLIAKGQVKGILEVFHRGALEPDAEWFDFLNTLAGQTAIAIENSTLFESLQHSNSELGMAYDATIEDWSRALDLRDKETEGHTQRLTGMTLKLAREFGLSETDLVQIRWGALLHDIGKMGVPDGVLFKPEPLTDDEWAVIKKHPSLAFEMLSPIHYLRNALDIPYCHHEKWDGSGYPRGLKGNQIPLAARIFAVVDVWDALTSKRPYRQAWSEEKTIEYIQAGGGTHFDPKVVKAFMIMMNKDHKDAC